MGYYMSQVDADFFIAKENFPEVIKAIHQMDFDGSWVRVPNGWHQREALTRSNFRDTTDLEEIFNCWRWEIFFDEDDNVMDISFRGEKLGDDELLFRAIAPYVRKGSFIQMNGEGTDQWRWVFNGVSCYEQHPTVIWD